MRHHNIIYIYIYVYEASKWSLIKFMPAISKIPMVMMLEYKQISDTIGCVQQQQPQ